VGTALIQEWRFNQYCMRLQRMISEKLDSEFKLFMRWRGINIDSNLFELKFNEPQNFASYRQAEVDSSRIASFTQLEAYPYLAKRFLLSRYLGLTEEEMSDNERMWAEEQGDVEKAPSEAAGLRSVGISPGGLDTDLSAAQMPEIPAADVGEVPNVAPPGEAGAAAAAPAAPSIQSNWLNNTMQVNELYEPTPAGYRTDKQDNSTYNMHDNRKRSSKITLDKLNRLRIMNDTRKLEHEQKLEKVGAQYKAPAAAAGGL
jgi:hypothetical protein